MRVRSTSRHDGRSGIELWKTDGTPGGTVQVADVNPTGSSVPANLRQIRGRLYFTATDGVHGEELWTSDGTAAGTRMVIDLNPAGGSYPHYVVTVGDSLFFAADDGATGTQLWRVSGCGEGQSCSVAMLPLPGSPPSPRRAVFLVKDVNPGPGDGDPYYLTGVGDTLFFQGFRPDTGIELWASDGTEAGTRLVRDLNPGAVDSSPYAFTDLGGVAFFVAYDSRHGAELWRSDGTEAGTVLVRDIAPGYESSYPRNLTVVGDTLWFTAYSPGRGAVIWRTDGTETGTEPLDLFPGDVWYDASSLAAVGDTLFFVLPRGSDGPGPTLWKTSDALGGAFRVFWDFFWRTPAPPGQLTPVGDLLFFRANGGELWRSDGTIPSGTIALTPNGTNPEHLTAMNGLLFFSGKSADSGRELSRSDGTRLGTWQVKDLHPGPADGMPGHLTNVNGTLFFSAADGVTGFELWKSDGTEAGTVLVRDIDPTDVTVPSYFQAVTSSTSPRIPRASATSCGAAMARPRAPRSSGTST